MRIAGIDPGLEITGYGIVDVEGPRMRVVTAGALRSSVGRPLAARLQALHDGIAALCRTAHPETIALEALYSHYAHPTTAILMGHVRGVILLAAAEAGIAVESYPATHIKKAVTGRGHATKAQMQRMVQMLLQLPALPEPADVADALAMAITHAHALRAPRPGVGAGRPPAGAPGPRPVDQARVRVPGHEVVGVTPPPVRRDHERWSIHS